jgi:molecular chaperone HtpG
MKSRGFVLYPTVDDKYYTLEIKENLAANQTDKDGKCELFYTLVTRTHSTYIETAKEKRI